MHEGRCQLKRRDDDESSCSDDSFLFINFIIRRGLIYRDGYKPEFYFLDMLIFIHCIFIQFSHQHIVFTRIRTLNFYAATGTDATICDIVRNCPTRASAEKQTLQ